MESILNLLQSAADDLNTALTQATELWGPHDSRTVKILTAWGLADVLKEEVVELCQAITSEAPAEKAD